MRRSLLRRGIRSLRIAAALAVIGLPTVVLPALAPAASVASLSLVGGAGTLTLGGTLYAKAGGTVGIDVATSADAGCVRIFLNGAPVMAQSNPAGDGAAWHFDLTAPATSGMQQVRATAYATPDCHGAWGSATGAFVADSSGPRISPLITPTPNVYGWNNAPVSIRARVNDGGMVGVDQSSVGPILTRYGIESAGIPVVIAASDRLGNRSQTSVTVRVDRTAPSVSVDGVADGATYLLGNVPPAGCHGSDALSGIDSCEGGTSGGAPNGVGTRTYTATATDRAGNSSSAHVSYHVVYDFRWAGTNPTSVAAGGTITFRVQLLAGNGTVVQASSAPTIIGGTGTVTWNATSHRYVVTEKPSGSAGSHATVGVRLDDGTEHTFAVALT